MSLALSTASPLPPIMMLALALLCALLTGLTGRSLRGGLYAGLVLALCLPILLPDAAPARSTLTGPPPSFQAARLSELVLPDLWQPLPGGVPNLVALAYEVDAPTLRTQAPGPADPAPLAPPGSPEGARLHLSISALCLALMALVGVKGAPAWIGRVLLVAGLAMACRSQPDLAGTTDLTQIGLITTSFGLALLAGLALGSLKPLGDDDSVAAALFLGAVTLIVFAGLGGWAAWSGSAQPSEVVEPLIARLAQQGAPEPSPLMLGATAKHLVSVLDHGALAALAAMTALLLHLKGRRLPSAGLVFLVTAAELLVVQFGWPFG